MVELAKSKHFGWLLTKILGDDMVTDEQGKPQIGNGTAPERIISLTEPHAPSMSLKR